MREMFLLLAAALLEVGGDALIRAGLKVGGVFFLLAGAAVLAGYGFMINLTRLDFGRLMGIYIVMFFVVAQAVSVTFFGEHLSASVLIGGILVLAGGLVMAIGVRTS